MVYMLCASSSMGDSAGTAFPVQCWIFLKHLKTHQHHMPFWVGTMYVYVRQ